MAALGSTSGQDPFRNIYAHWTISPKGEGGRSSGRFYIRP